ncbi:hypothetical protein [Agromyces kandeliae]|uniref:hypothetical protein n=1 Tax=Agromyces kandeliae TaxID=2666141 RepID=UPI001E40D1EE|nr:hypothetical protein [Agromyces kandeliae]
MTTDAAAKGGDVRARAAARHPSWVWLVCWVVALGATALTIWMLDQSIAAVDDSELDLVGHLGVVFGVTVFMIAAFAWIWLVMAIQNGARVDAALGRSRRAFHLPVGFDTTAVQQVALLSKVLTGRPRHLSPRALATLSADASGLALFTRAGLGEPFVIPASSVQSVTTGVRHVLFGTRPTLELGVETHGDRLVVALYPFTWEHPFRSVPLEYVEACASEIRRELDLAADPATR